MAFDWEQAAKDAADVARSTADAAYDAEERAGIADTPSIRPVIKMGTDLQQNVTDGISALSVGDRGVYQRRGSLVHIVRVPADEAECGRLAGSPEVRTLSLASLRERLSSVASWLKPDARAKAKTWKSALPTDPIIQAAAARGEWRNVRPIVGITEAPVLRPDGSVLQVPGYDAATGYVLEPSATFPPVPDLPRQQDASAALAELAEPFADFPFRADADRSVPIAAILSLLARPAIRGSVPAFVFDASTRGAGKSRLADVVAIIATGRPAPRASWPAMEEELEKILGSYALRAAALVAFDNLSLPFSGAPLDKVLTATDLVDLRILGRSEMPSLPWRAVILATGNNVVVKGDTERRVLVSRLEPREENPEERTGFAHPDLLAWVAAERPRLVAAALTILRAFVVAGRPSGPKPWGSFEAWSELIAGAIVFASGTDPLGARPTTTGEGDPEKFALLQLLEHWPRLDSSGVGLTAKAAIDALYNAERRRGAATPPDGFDDLRDALESLAPPRNGQGAPDPTKVGYVLRRMRGRNVGGRRLEVSKDRTGLARWHVEDARQ